MIIRSRYSGFATISASIEIADKQELAGDMAPSIGYEKAGLVLQLHESLLTNGAHRMKFAGQSMTDAQVKAAVDAIIKAAKTGKIGDGKIFVSAIEEAVRIRTDERGDSAV